MFSSLAGSTIAWWRFGGLGVRAGLIDEELVTALYDTALYGGDWQPALERFRVLLNSAEASLCDIRGDLRDTQTHTSGHLLTPEMREPYFQYYGSIDPKLEVLYRNQIAYLFNDARHFDAAFVARNPFYQEYTKSLGMRHTLDMTMGRGAETETFLAVMRASSQGPYDPGGEAVFHRCARHFERVMNLAKKLEHAQHGGTLASAALDRLRLGVVVVSIAGCVVLSNRAAEEACTPGEELQLRNGKLTARSAKFAQRLGDGINRALQQHGTASVLQTQRTPAGERVVWIAPLPAKRNIADGPGAIVLIGGPAQRSAARPDELAAIYGLTSAEAELAVAIGNGVSLKQAAAKRGVKLSTVRSQTLSLLQKTGARRQADLVRMIATLPSSLLRDSPSQ